MWTSKQTPIVTGLEGVPVSPLQVLYYFDGPVVFTARLGLLHVIFQKFDEASEGEYFIVSETNEPTINALRQGRMSLRGAVEAERFWVVRAIGALTVDCIWDVSIYDFPLMLLPQKGNALFHCGYQVPDTLDQATGFFSVKYSDIRLTRESISFRMLKSLISDVYEVANSYLLPAIEGVSKYSVTDFDVSPIKFASLLISIKNPRVLEDAIRRRKLSIAPTFGLLGQIQQQRDDLIEGIEEVVAEARVREITVGFASDRFSWISAVNALAPSRSDAVDFIEVAASGEKSARMVVIDAEAAHKIKHAHREVIRNPVTLTGRVVVINLTASTFVFRASNGRKITVEVDRGRFNSDVASNALRARAQVAVTGLLTRRTYRDFMSNGVVNYLD